MIIELIILNIFLLLFYKNPRTFSYKLEKYLGGYIETINKFNAKYFNDSLPVGVIGAIIMTESSGNPTLDGSSGERGLMQIMPNTFESLKELHNFDFEFSQLYNAKLNILTGMFLISDNIKRFGSVQDAIRAYNVGTDLKPYSVSWKYLFKVWDWL